MNGLQIQKMLDSIDRNVGMYHEEVADYLLTHTQAIAESLAQKGTADIPTGAGVLRISRADLDRVLGSLSAAAA